MVYIFTIQKVSPYWGPVQPFLNIVHDFGHIFFWKRSKTFWVQNLGHILVKKLISFRLGAFFDWETSIHICPLFVHFSALAQNYHQPSHLGGGDSLLACTGELVLNGQAQTWGTFAKFPNNCIFALHHRYCICTFGGIFSCNYTLPFDENNEKLYQQWRFRHVKGTWNVTSLSFIINPFPLRGGVFWDDGYVIWSYFPKELLKYNFLLDIVKMLIVYCWAFCSPPSFCILCHPLF